MRNRSVLLQQQSFIWKTKIGCSCQHPFLFLWNALSIMIFQRQECWPFLSHKCPNPVTSNISVCRNQHRPLHKATRMREGFDVSPEGLQLDFLLRQWQSLLSEEQLNSAGPSEKKGLLQTSQEQNRVEDKNFHAKETAGSKIFWFP